MLDVLTQSLGCIKAFEAKITEIGRVEYIDSKVHKGSLVSLATRWGWRWEAGLPVPSWETLGVSG